MPLDKRVMATIARGVLLNSAKTVGAHYQPFSQYTIGHEREYDQWIGPGLCQGISIKFLEAEKQGQDIRHYFNHAKLSGCTNTPLHDEFFNASIAGNIMVRDSKVLHQYMQANYRFGIVKEKNFRIKDGCYKSIASFINHSNYGARYYLISTGHHVMGVVTNRSKGGRFFGHNESVFLDPNCGLIRCRSSLLPRLFEEFFGHSFTSDAYGLNQGGQIAVWKYKAV